MGSCVSTEAPPAPMRLEPLSKPTPRLPAVGPDASFSSSKDLSSAASSTDGNPSTKPTIHGAPPRHHKDLAIKYSALKVGEPLGTGPHGIVAAATLRGADVAVRAFSKPPTKAALRQAAESAAALRHPHVVCVLGYCSDPPALVFERCARGSLSDVITAARDDPDAAAELTWARRLRMLGDIAAGMAYLHSRSPLIVHGNLKASNCLIDDAGMVKIADLAPVGAKATPAADLLAFGLIMWELLTWEASANNIEPVDVCSSFDGEQEVKLALPKLAAFPGPQPANERSLPRYLSLMEKCMHPQSIDGADPDCSIDFVRVLREITGLTVLER